MRIMEEFIKEVGEFLSAIFKVISGFFKWTYKYIIPIVLGVLFINIFLFFFAVPEWGWVLGIINLIAFVVALVKVLNSGDNF